MAEGAWGTGTRRALAVATGRYRHPSLPDLESPAKDAEALERVLGDARVGRFAPVTVLHNADRESARMAIHDFFAEVEPNDFVFAYFSGHGLKDADGRHYLATIDTDPSRPMLTGIESEWVAGCLSTCRANHVVVVMDCCYAGRFLAALRPRGDIERIVIVSTSAVQLAHEGDEGTDGPRPSVFGQAFFEGIETGAADFDGNGWTSVREAFDYAVERVRHSGRDQTPKMETTVTGDLWLAQAPAHADTLPKDLAALVRSANDGARLAAVEELTARLAAPDAGHAATAEAALVTLLADPVEKVALGARRALARRHIEAAVLPVAAHVRDPLWYKKAVCYEVRIRSFSDGDADGVGDLRGLIGRLDYLSWLGADCLILSSIFDSPLREDGDDVSDYGAIHRRLGDLGDFVELVDAVHRRGLHLVLDLPLTFTSDHHAWFEESRRDPAGPYGDFYVWRDSAEADDLRVPPGDAASAQWRYDPLRGQYYWHRFLPHTPDLNFANPAVQDAMLGVLRRWLDLGIDGFRLVAVPYLHRREEMSDETHAYLRRIRREVDRLYPGRVLIADANQWPLQAAAYFGRTPGDECHMVLYASLMPRLFLAMRQEDHLPVSELLTTAPGIPDTCQWGVFLRNGDALSLEGLTEPDRAYLLDEYAPRPRMRTEDGIRRRLAPLLDNDRMLLELAFSLLLSMPGTPIVYYGDEIGMGDNLTLAGIHSVRTPMQWSPDRNGGFSTAEPDRLALPALMDSVFGYQATNVEAQRRSRSLLSFLRRLLEIRRHNPAFALGELRVVKTTNPAILAYVRIHQGARVLCVTNFSRYPQAVELDLEGYLGRTPVEILGGSRFLPIESPAYPMTLSGHGFYWLTL